jgi:hypothetical protein
MKEKRAGLMVMAVIGLVAAIALADVAPQTCTFTNLRNQATSAADPNGVTFWRGDSLVLTNCVLSSTTTNWGARQDLTMCVVTCKVGSTDSSAAYAGVVQSTNGLYSTTFTVPGTGTVYVQTTVTATNTGASYTYGWKLLSVKDKL